MMRKEHANALHITTVSDLVQRTRQR